MFTPLITVIVPIYKVEEYLDRCVQSIVDQTYPHLEIILVDDGSPDRCPQMCDEWAKKDARIRVIHKKNGGLSDARNAGYAVAKGELISFIDSDDWVEPDFFRILYEALTKTDSDIASCRYRKVFEGETPLPTDTNYQINTSLCEEALSDLIDGKVQQVVWNKLYRRCVIGDILFEKGKYHEDEFWAYQIIGNCKQLAVTDYVGLNYFQRAESIMGQNYSKKRLHAVEAKTQRQIYLHSCFPVLSFKGHRNLLFTCLYHGQLTKKHLKNEDKKSSLQFLKSVIRENPLPLKETKDLSLAHRVWLWLSQHNFSLACTLRNILKIGF